MNGASFKMDFVQSCLFVVVRRNHQLLPRLNLVRVVKLIAIGVEDSHVLIRVSIELFANPGERVARFDRVSLAAALAATSSRPNSPT